MDFKTFFSDFLLICIEKLQITLRVYIFLNKKNILKFQYKIILLHFLLKQTLMYYKEYINKILQISFHFNKDTLHYKYF